MKVNFYIDGFNFYFGLRAQSILIPNWKQYYWLDMVKFCENFLGQNQELNKVKYFTARPLSSGKASRWSAFLGANRIINEGKFETINGNYQKKDINCPKCNKLSQHPEEKMTDVNIATQMIGDCYNKKIDKIVLITGDSDLLPPLEFINEYVEGVSIKLVFPPERQSYELYQFMKSKRIRVTHLSRNESFFKNSIMPDIVKSETKTYTRPHNWQ